MRELDFDLLRERLSPNAIRVLSISIEESRRRNHNFLSDEHILLALCKKEPELIDCSLCCDSIKLADLTLETKDFLDKTPPRVGRSLRMTPELQRTLRIAWENILQKNRRQIETFDLLEALQQNGTSDVWQRIRQTGLREEQIHENLERYAKVYFEKEQIKNTIEGEFEFAERQLKATLKNVILPLERETRHTQTSTFIWFSSLVIICAIVVLFVLAIIKC